MNWSQGGEFTKSLLSLQLQLQTLLEGVGGEGTASLLDGLAKLSETERALVIPVISQVIGRIVNGEQRLASEEDKHLKEFEDSLFESVLSAMGGAQKEIPANSDEGKPESTKKLAVVPGGKSPAERVTFKRPVRIPTLIDLAKARESRRQRTPSPHESA
jgi:hypothetical protein